MLKVLLQNFLLLLYAGQGVDEVDDGEILDLRSRSRLVGGELEYFSA